jgi:RNA polymerase sigma factor (sigma-70 family)
LILGSITYRWFEHMNLGEASDEVLVDAIARGDNAALGELFSRYHKDVYRFLVRLTAKDAHDLDDMVQNTFIEVRRSASRYAERSSPRGWLFGIAANVARMRIRKETRRKSALSMFQALPAFRPATPHEQTARRQELDIVQTEILAMPVSLRETFVMCALENISCREAAHCLGIPEGTVWRRIHEARTRLCEALSKGGKR